jgi:hypothetical protein
MIEIDKGLIWPELALQFLARDHLSGAVEQHAKNLKGLTLQPEPTALSDQLTGRQVQFEVSKLSFPSFDCFETCRHGVPRNSLTGTRHDKDDRNS